MSPKVYQIERGGKIVTVKSFNDPVGMCRGLFRLTGRYIPWVNVNDKVTKVGDDITVTEVDIPLAWVKWCPQLLERVDAYRLPPISIEV